ncbi:MAG TPA: hypothetical protein VKZ50_05055 [bacterium]|nr:hypothetical protein [bacterium]
MRRKGFHRVTPEQARQQAIATLKYLRDECVRMAKDSLASGEWRVALTCLGKARMYDDQRHEMDPRGDDLLEPLVARAPESLASGAEIPAVDWFSRA